MNSTHFLSNESLWENISDLVKNASHIDAAIAYFGTDGARLLQLRKNDCLIVDMSPATVKAGGTNPHAIEKLLNRGVRVFSRSNLHAKIILSDKCLITSSANISGHSKDTLDEAGLFTNDRIAIQRARAFIQSLCTEPVRQKYLNMCKGLYRSPKFNNQTKNANRKQLRINSTKLWIITIDGNVNGVPASEEKRYDQGTKKAEKMLAKKKSETASFHSKSELRILSDLQKGHWIVLVTKYDDGTSEVAPPGQFLFIDSYVRDKQKKLNRWVYHLEVPAKEQTMSWKKFKQRLQTNTHFKVSDKPRDRAVSDVKIADGILRMWSDNGNVSLKKS